MDSHRPQSSDLEGLLQVPSHFRQNQNVRCHTHTHTHTHPHKHKPHMVIHQSPSVKSARQSQHTDLTAKSMPRDVYLSSTEPQIGSKKCLANQGVKIFLEFFGKHKILVCLLNMSFCRKTTKFKMCTTYLHVTDL